MRVKVGKELSFGESSVGATRIHLALLYTTMKCIEELWRIIPITMRPWWLDSVRSINHFGEYPFQNCNISTPDSILFVDRTVSLAEFEDDLESRKQARLERALNNEDINLPNVLCPFGCTGYLVLLSTHQWNR